MREAISDQAEEAMISELWYCRNQEKWLKPLADYWNVESVRRNEALERRMDALSINQVKSFSIAEWYRFLLNEYYRWKFTDDLLYAQNSRHLRFSNDEAGRQKLKHMMQELDQFRKELFSFDQKDIRLGLKIARRDGKRKIGLGTAAASGLLAILYPEHFGTADQFVVKSLREVINFRGGHEVHDRLSRMNPKNLSINDGVLLIQIMRQKATELNECFGTNQWTPRRIDKVLWTVRQGATITCGS